MKEPGRTPGRPDRSEGSPGKPKGRPDAAAEAPGALRHPFRSVIALIVLAVLGLMSTAAFKSYRDLESAKNYERGLLEKIAGAKERIQALDNRIERIRHDPVMLERLAREDLGLVHDGDVVIVLPDLQKADSDNANPQNVRTSPSLAGSKSAEPAVTGSKPQTSAGTTAP